MSFRRSLSVLVLLFSAIVSHSAQTLDETAKLKTERQSALIEQVLADAPNLKLGENRALVYAKLGAIIWKSDEKRARTLFRDAAGELINAQMLAETDKKNNGYQHDLLMGQTTRPQILHAIAARDAELALEYLYKTRPAAIAKAFSMSAGKSSKISGNSNNYDYLAQNETNLEQSFVRLAADQSPERAAKLLKESLKKGFSGETINLLKKLRQKDAATADEIAAELVNKLIGTKFDAPNASNYQNINVATMFLTEFVGQKSDDEKALKFDDAQMRRLAEKLVAAALQPNDRHGYHNIYSLVPIAEKLAPSSVEQLRRLQKNGSRRGMDFGYDPEMGKLLNGEATAEHMLGAAKKFPVHQRGQIYRTAANKLAQAGDLIRANQVLNDNFDDDALDDALHHLNWQYSYNLINAGKFAEAESLIDNFPENTRLGALVNLANAVYQKNPQENKSYAVAVLGKARALVSERPEDSQEMSNLMQIISAYVAVEPVEAFRLFEPLIPQMNELSEAAVVINGFQRNSNIKHGEFLLTNGGSWGFYAADFSILTRLAANDFDRALKLIDDFTRRETRVSLKMQLAESIQIQSSADNSHKTRTLSDLRIL